MRRRNSGVATRLGNGYAKPVDIGFPSPRGMMLAFRAGILARLHPSPCLPAQSAVAYDGVVRLTAAGAAPEWLLNYLADSPASRLTFFRRERSAPKLAWYTDGRHCASSAEELVCCVFAQWQQEPAVDDDDKAGLGQGRPYRRAKSRIFFTFSRKFSFFGEIPNLD
jgi:hypothetical protein